MNLLIKAIQFIKIIFFKIKNIYKINNVKIN
jgi:hypothetical protein